MNVLPVRYKRRSGNRITDSNSTAKPSMAKMRWLTTLGARRHGFLVLRDGPESAPNLMGSKKAAMTMRYAHTTSERRRAAIGKVLA